MVNARSAAHRVVAVVAAVLASLGLAAAGTPSAEAGVAPRLADVSLAFGTDELFNEADNELSEARPGSWRITDGRLLDGDLAFRLNIIPPGRTLQVDSGPAVLFTGMRAYGGRGDVGLEVVVRNAATTPVAACLPDDCAYELDVRIGTSDVLPAIERLRALGSNQGGQVLVNLTFVRTFGHGTWLQVLPLSIHEEFLPTSHGRFGAIEAAEGEILPWSLFPTGEASSDYGRDVEEERLHLPDDSRPIPMAPVVLHAEIGSACAFPRSLAAVTAAGDRLLELPVTPGLRTVVTGFAAPLDTATRLVLRHHSGEVDTGPLAIRSSGEPIRVDARFDCPSIEITTASLVEATAAPSGDPSLAPATSSGDPRPATAGPVPSSAPPAGSQGPEPGGLMPLIVVGLVAGLVGLAIGLAVRRRAG